MRVLAQRVSYAQVTVEGETLAKIGRGLVLFVGIARDDTVQDVCYVVRKILEMRIFPDRAGRFDKSVRDIGGDVMLVSQFTLLAQTKRGRRPNFECAMSPGLAVEVFEQVVKRFKESGLYVAVGRFGANMDVNLLNDGPVTILVDSHER